MFQNLDFYHRPILHFQFPIAFKILAMSSITQQKLVQFLRLTKDQLNSGASDMYLLSMLIRQFRIFLQIKELTRGGEMPPAIIAKEIRVHPYVAKKSVYYLRHFSIEELRSIYKKLFEFEIKMKTGRGSFELMFDLFVSEL